MLYYMIVRSLHQSVVITVPYFRGHATFKQRLETEFFG